MEIRALTLDLDDTLWPFAPVARNIEAAVAAWLREHAPRTAAASTPEATRRALEDVRRDRADLAHDLGALRREAMRRMFEAAGDDPSLAEPAFAVAWAARQEVELYPEVPAALDRLAARYRLVAVTNGNADVEHIGIGGWFDGVLTAAELRVAKPDPRIFAAACERLELPREAVLHAGDDLVTDVAGALAAGLHAAWVHRDLSGEPPPGALRARDLSELADAMGA